jgi:hypothetical protein
VRQVGASINVLRFHRHPLRYPSRSIMNATSFAPDCDEDLERAEIHITGLVDTGEILGLYVRRSCILIAPNFKESLLHRSFDRIVILVDGEATGRNSAIRESFFQFVVGLRKLDCHYRTIRRRAGRPKCASGPLSTACGHYRAGADRPMRRGRPEARLLERKLRAAAGLRRRRVRDGEFSSVTLLYSLPFFSFAYSAKSEAISPAEVSTTSAAPRKR